MGDQQTNNGDKNNNLISTARVYSNMEDILRIWRVCCVVN